MAAWVGWELGRLVLILTAALFADIWVQVTLLHWAGGFKHVAMWAPVVTTPLFAAAAVAGVATREGGFGWVIAVVMVIAVGEGIAGFGFHLVGIRGQIGGFSVRNVLSGPPPMLPAAYALIGVLGLVAVAWNG